MSTLALYIFLFLVFVSAFLIRALLDRTYAVMPATPGLSTRDRAKTPDRSLIWLTTCTLIALFLNISIIGYIELVTQKPMLRPLPMLICSVLWTVLFAMLVIRQTGTARLLRVAQPMLSMNWRGIIFARPDRLLLLVAITTAIITFSMLIVGFPRGFEVIAYHLPIGVNMFQTGSLKTWDHGYMHTFPANMSVISGLLLQIFPERLVSAANLPFLLLLGGVVYKLSLLSGADRSSASLVAVGTLTIPIVAFSSLELGSDVAGVALLGVALFLVLRSPAVTSSDAFTSGLASGLAFGFKSLHIVGVAIVGCILVFRVVSQRGEDNSGKFFKCVTLYAAGFFALASFWLVRNYVELGNPLYPVSLPGFDRLGFRSAPDVDYSARHEVQFEWVRASWEWLVYPWVEWHYIGQNYKHSSGLGPFFAAFAPVAFGYWMARGVTTWWRPQAVSGPDDGSSIHAQLTLGVLGIFAVWWVLDDRQPRYFMGSFVFLMPLIAAMLSRLYGPWRRTADIVAYACILTMLFVIVSKQGIEFSSRFLVSKQYDRWQFYGYPQQVDDLPDGARIANLFERTPHYGLAGKHLRNRVIPSTTASAILEPLESPAPLFGDSAPESGNSATDVSFGGSQDRQLYRVNGFEVERLGATHLYVTGPHQILSADACVTFVEIGNLSKNPSNKVPLLHPSYLYEIKRC